MVTKIGTDGVENNSPTTRSGIAVFTNELGQEVKSSRWTISGRHDPLRSPIYFSGDYPALLLGGAVPTGLGGWFGGGLAELSFNFSRGPNISRFSDNWNIGYNMTPNTLVSGVPHYGIGFETCFDTSSLGANNGASSEMYFIHRIDNGAGIPDASGIGSVPGGRFMQWNVTLPPNFCVQPNNRPYVPYSNTSGQIWGGYVSILQVANLWTIGAGDPSGVSTTHDDRAYDGSNGAGISFNLNKGIYKFAGAIEPDKIRMPNGKVRVISNSGSTPTESIFHFMNTTTSYNIVSGAEIGLSDNNLIMKLKGGYGGEIRFSPNESSYGEGGGLRITKTRRFLFGHNSIADAGEVYQFHQGNIHISGAGDSTLRIQGGNNPGLKIIGNGFPSAVDITTNTTNFMFRVNDNLPIVFATQGTQRLSVHNVVSLNAPLRVNNAFTGVSNAAVLAAASGTLAIQDVNGTVYYVLCAATRP